jgi:hypothetical protein
MSETESSPTPDSLRGTVLVVEDDPSSLALAEAMLARFPRLRVLHATTGREAVTLALAEHPDLMLLDMRLPDISGLEVVRALNPAMTDRALRVVLLTADSFSIEVVKAMSLGAREYWPKPLTLERMDSGLLRLLGGA